ncbi:uncharacterized protein LOC116850761 [Odontomachus brunneus]|uniref:uncharacterized protein LOC116850761 n=1 Tax=Odontomachus brunneus TaxID=486640 RepID=UPI0013F29F4D|nr:uncharacterized protein LOC116850761 [Odontomachus brunneus]
MNSFEYPKVLSRFYGPYTEEKYNQFFNPNVCHVCKRPSRDLITCNQCNMISYCSKEHQKVHKYSHLEMCNAITFVITDISYWDTYRNSEEWMESRQDVTVKILAVLSRETYRYETEMLIFPKSCYVCYKQINVQPCQICYSANFCNDHKILFHRNHTDCCAKLLLLLNMNITHINGSLKEIVSEYRHKFIKFPGAKPYDDIVTFINNYVFYRHLSILPNYTSNSTRLWHLKHYICSDFVSGPMTLYYALQESNLSLPSNPSKYIVHLIDADIIDVISSQFWHIFLHFFKDIKELRIVFIKSPILESKYLGSVCSMCRRDGQKLHVTYVPEPYNDYVHLESFEQPNVIVLLETETVFVRTWFKSIKAVVAQNCPLLLTADSKSTVEGNVDKIQEETGISRRRLYRKNKFRSCTPYRNYITGGFFYRNAHFIMYS